MSTHDEYMTRRQARDLARRLARLERKQRSTAAANDLPHSSIDGGVFKIKDADGNTAYELGTDPTTGVTAPQYRGGPVPAQPSEPFVDVGGEVVKIQHSGLDAHEDAAPADFRRAQIHVSQDEVFEPSLSSLAGYLEEADGSFTHRLPGGEWYVGIVWETLSGKQSVMSGTVLADIPPLVDAQDIEDTLAEAEQIIADAVAAAQTELDELRDRLDNFEEFDPTDLIAQINQVNADLADARQEAAGLVSDLADRVDDIKIPDVSGFITQAEVDAAAAAAETAAKEHADLVAQGAKDDAIAEAEAKANAAREAAEQAAKTYTDQQDAQVKIDAAADAQTKADAAADAAEAAAATHAELVAQGAEESAIAEAERLHALAVAEAQAAKTRADEAHNEAGSAWDHADAALTRAVNAETNAKQHADNLPKMLGGSGGPVGTAPNGSIWFRRDSNNTVTGRWERIGGSWVQQEVSGELIDNLEAGKITALHTEFAESVIGKLWTQLAIVDRLIATSAWIGGAMIGDDAVEAKHIVASETLSGKVAEFLKLSVADLVATGAQVDDAVIRKLWVDGLVGLSATLARATIAAPNLWPDPEFEQAVYGSWSRVDGGIERDGSTSLAVSYVTHSDFYIPIELGAKYRVSADLTLDGPGRGDIWTRDADENKTYIGGSVRGHNRTESGHFEVIYEPSFAHAKYLYIGFGTNNTDPTTRLRFENLRVERMTDGSLIVDDTIRTRHLQVTEDMVGRFAEFLHLVVDRIDANALWADQTWQAAGHFGSDSADQSTLVDGTGLRITKHDQDNETSTDIVRLGGEGIGLVFSDDQGDITGALSYEGDAAFRNVSADTFTLSGRPLQDPDCHDYVHPSGNQSLLTWRPRAIMGWGARQVPVINSGYREYGFLEVAANLEAGRNYWLIVSPFTWSPNDAANHLRIRYTTDGTAPKGDSPFAVNQRMSVDGHGYVTPGGQWLFTPTVTGQHRFMLSIQAWGRVNQTITSAGNVAQFVIEDAGSAVPEGTVIREAQLQHPSGNADIVGPIITSDSFTTEWEAAWFQNYSNGTIAGSSSDNRTGYGGGGPVQGRPSSVALMWSSLFSFYTGATAGETEELGKVPSQATAGATIQAIHLEVTGAWSAASYNQTNFNLIVVPQTIAPNTFPTPIATIGQARISPGQKARISLPVDTFGPLIKSSDFRTVGIHTTSNFLAAAGRLSWKHRPKLIITYTKEGN